MMMIVMSGGLKRVQKIIFEDQRDGVAESTDQAANPPRKGHNPPYAGEDNRFGRVSALLLIDQQLL